MENQIIISQKKIIETLTSKKIYKISVSKKYNFVLCGVKSILSAAADLCVGLISVLTDIIWKITISWEAGLIACKLIRFLQAVVTYASTFVLVALSIDR